MDLNLIDTVKTVQALGTLGSLIIAVWAYHTRRVVPRGEYDEVAEERKALNAKIETANQEVREMAKAAIAAIKKDGAT